MVQVAGRRLDGETYIGRRPLFYLHEAFFPDDDNILDEVLQKDLDEKAREFIKKYTQSLTVDDVISPPATIPGQEYTLLSTAEQ